MPNDAKLSRQIEKVSKEVTTVQEMTELVSWDGVVRATFTTYKIVDGVRYEIGSVTTSRFIDIDQKVSDWFDQGYANAQGWLAEDIANADVKPDVAVAVDVPAEIKTP